MKIIPKNLLSSARTGIIFLLICAAFLFRVETSFADPSQGQQQENQYISTLKAAIKSATEGPATIPLINEGSLHIPKNYLFIPKNEASAFMKANGNTMGPDFVGLIISKVDNLRWFITVNFIKSGYVRDDDAKNWSADALMKSLKKGTDEANKGRVAAGFPPLEIEGWVETPKYDASTHKLIWSTLAKDKGSNSEPLVNYNTFVLGREGYFKLDLVTPNSSIAQDKLIAYKILSSLYYNNGKRYEDFNRSTDRIAKYGLAALITGIAVKKLGLLALAGAFLHIPLLTERQFRFKSNANSVLNRTAIVF